MGYNIKRPAAFLRVSGLICLMLFLAPAPAGAEFTLADEVELGRKFNLLIHSSAYVLLDTEVTEYTNYLLQRLLAGMPSQPFRFSVSVIRDPAVNAFAVPGGYIYLHTGLLLAMRSEAEVAGVLAHELAHVTQRHIAGRMAKAQRVTLLSTLAILAGAFLGGGGDAGLAAAAGGMAAGQAAMLSYSRADEAEADQVGMGYFIAAQYPPDGMVEGFRVIQRPQWVTGSEIPAYLSTHPDIAARITELSARAKNLRRPYAVNEPDERRFLRVQTLIRGRYAGPEAALSFFAEQSKGPYADLAQLGLGLLYERLNRVQEAGQAFERAVRAQPNDYLTLREAGRFNYLKGDRDSAVHLLQKATAQNPRDYLALLYYARLLADAGQREQAIDCYKQILRRQPEDPETHYYYAQVLSSGRTTFPAQLHLAYAYLYENNAVKTEQAYQRAGRMAENAADKAELELFEQRYQERREYWQ